MGDVFTAETEALLFALQVASDLDHGNFILEGDALTVVHAILGDNSGVRKSCYWSSKGYLQDLPYPLPFGNAVILILLVIELPIT